MLPELLLRGGRGRPKAHPPDLDLFERLRQGSGRRLRILEDPAQGDLELGELRVGVVLGFAPHPPRLLVGLCQDPLRLLLGALNDGLLAGHPHLLLTCLVDDLLRVQPGLGQELFAIPHDPTSLLDLLRQALLHVGEQVKHLLPVHQRRGGQGHRLRLSDHLLELREPTGEVHQRPSIRSTRRLRT